MRTVVHERKVREFNPVIQACKTVWTIRRQRWETPRSMARIQNPDADENHQLMGGNDSPQYPETLSKVMRLGAKIQNLIHGDSAKR